MKEDKDEKKIGLEEAQFSVPLWKSQPDTKSTLSIEEKNTLEHE